MAYDNNMDINPERMIEVSGKIKTTGDNYNEKISNLFKTIEDMNNYWSGQEYDSAKAKFEEFRPTLNKLGELIAQTIPNDINIAVDNYNNVQQRIRNMFG